MVEDMLGAYGSRFVIAVLGVGVGLILLIVVLKMMRSRNGPSPFIRGGKNRQPRLQVLDAAAVDTRRRLVLVRRDDVEHLIMIGGPTDIVIESGISLAGHAPATVAAPSGRFTPAEMPVAAPAAEMRSRPVEEPRPAPPLRSVALEPQIEAARENPATPTPPAPVAPPAAPAAGTAVNASPATTAPPPRPVPPAAAAPVPAAPAPSQAIEPPVRPAPEVKPEPMRPIAALAAATAADNAANVLDAARGRVFHEPPEPRAAPAGPAVVPPAPQPAAEKPKQFGSDFERILEQEMAGNLAAREPVPPAGQPPRRMPPRDPSVPLVTGASPDPSLQSEVARIFGEMSVTRDK